MLVGARTETIDDGREIDVSKAVTDSIPILLFSWVLNFIDD